jgi:Myb/SANT-like DNA-binding domain
LESPIPLANLRVTKEHHKIIVEFMENHPDLARNKLSGAAGRDMSRILWDRLAEKLNSCGHLIKSSDGWKKVT